jgi:Ca2+/Na+ antiporter
MNDELAGFPIFSSPALDENSGHCKSQGGGVGGFFFFLLVVVVVVGDAREEAFSHKKAIENSSLDRFHSQVFVVVVWTVLFVVFHQTSFPAIGGWLFFSSFCAHSTKTKKQKISRRVSAKNEHLGAYVDFFLFRIVVIVKKTHTHARALATHATHSHY